MSNRELRTAVKLAGVKHWELADELGVHEVTLCRRLRHELPESEQKEMLAAIERLRNRREAGE